MSVEKGWKARNKFMELNKKTLREIAQIIKQDWNPVYFSAKPYLDAMEQLDSVDESIGYDDGVSIVSYFLINAKQWKGSVAREVKAYLKKLTEEAN